MNSRVGLDRLETCPSLKSQEKINSDKGTDALTEKVLRSGKHNSCSETSKETISIPPVTNEAV